MKKLVYLVAVAFAACLVACGNNEKAQEAAVEEAPVVEVVEEAVVEECDGVACEGEVAVCEEVVEAAPAE